MLMVKYYAMSVIIFTVLNMTGLVVLFAHLVFIRKKAKQDTKD